MTKLRFNFFDYKLFGAKQKESSHFPLLRGSTLEDKRSAHNNGYQHSGGRVFATPKVCSSAYLFSMLKWIISF
jgi:hypothetical protein